MNPKLQPWRDYSGRLSPLKLLVFLTLFAPAIWISVNFSLHTGDFLARPLTEAIRQIGLWTIRFLMIALAITPARQIFQWSRLLLVRRMIGVAACAYVLTHFTLYVTDQAFDLTKVASEIVLRIYLTIGFSALLGLVTLAATSTDGMVRRLGARRWQRLHQIVYGIGVLAVIHYFMQSKLDVWEPTILAGMFAWLMGYRLIALAYPKSRPVPIWAIGLLSVSAGLGTAIGEAVYLWLTVGVDPLRVLPANLSLETGTRPSWIVLAAGIAVTAAAALRAATKQRPGSQTRTASPAARSRVSG